jgi:hypothetical protein
MAGRSVELVLLSYYDDWGKCRRATHLLYNRSRLKLLSFPELWARACSFRGRGDVAVLTRMLRGYDPWCCHERFIAIVRFSKKIWLDNRRDHNSRTDITP